MKKILQLFVTVLLILTVAAMSACNSTNRVSATEKASNITHAIDTGSWTFNPRDVMPQYGASRVVDANYSVKYNNNKLVVYLPYFGKAYSGANVFASNGPLDFTSNNFTITKRETKKGHTSVTIIPKDYNEVQSMNFMFYNNGTANLSITMTNRSAISFNGRVSGFK